MPGRNQQGDYRYAYQGQEKDPETGWEAFELRMYDGRVGRWMTTDPYSQYHSPYLAMGNDPIGNIDPNGGIVEYDSFGDFLNVFYARITSSGFRDEFRSLKNSNDVFTYKKVNSGGNIQLMNTNLNEFDELINHEFQINYSFDNPSRNDGLGKLKFHTLFEETFHAADYERNRSISPLTSNGVQVGLIEDFCNNINGSGKIFIGHNANDLSHEARAWIFAVDNAPGKILESYQTTVQLSDGSVIPVTNSNLLTTQIRNTAGQANRVQAVSNLLYNGFQITITNSDGAFILSDIIRVY